MLGLHFLQLVIALSYLFMNTRVTIRAKKVHCCFWSSLCLCFCVPDSLLCASGCFLFWLSKLYFDVLMDRRFRVKKRPLDRDSDCQVSLKVLWRSQNGLIVMTTKKSWWWCRQRSLDGEVDKGGKELLSRSTKVHPSGSPGLWAELGLSGATLPPMMDATTPSHKSCLCPPWLHPSVKRWSNTPAHEISQILKTRPNTM